MKHFVASLAGPCLALALLFSCAAPPANEPKAVAERFLGHLKNMEFKEAGALATDDAKQLLLYLDSLRGTIPADRIEESRSKPLAIDAVKQDGDSATVSYHLGGDLPSDLQMRKVDGVWKADFKKQL